MFFNPLWADKFMNQNFPRIQQFFYTSIAYGCLVKSFTIEMIPSIMTENTSSYFFIEKNDAIYSIYNKSWQLKHWKSIELFEINLFKETNSHQRYDYTWLFSFITSDPNHSHITMFSNIILYRWYINEKTVIGDYTTEMIIHNATRELHDAIVKCEVHNEVGKSEETETLDITCKYYILLCIYIDLSSIVCVLWHSIYTR